ncbi:MAG: DUF4334 domain-containing protein [Cyanobacteriota bacterium]|nr:DUF4334 domain-containing protein [Cyanobacteriota bacterium]
MVDLTPANPDTRRGLGEDRCEEVGLSKDSLEAALALFDQLEPVAPEELIGRWRGEGFPTGHPLDGVLEAWNWRGKRFESLEEVHPLVFAGPWGGEVCVDPSRVPMEVLRAGWVGRLAPLGSLSPWLVPLVSTRASAARLRGMSYRGKVSATMVYDALPIMDVFRRLDSERLLGLMDAKGLARPFFFVLRREGCAKA